MLYAFAKHCMELLKGIGTLLSIYMVTGNSGGMIALICTVL